MDAALSAMLEPWQQSIKLAVQAIDYWTDAWQRSILFLDVLRQRGNNYIGQRDATTPHVLNFQFEVIMRGDELPRPVNYGLVHILPPKDTVVDPRLRPFIVFDPRAGHGPGIGGMKHDSEIGVALSAGHPCYFVGFVPFPVSGQNVQDVCDAHAVFVQKVIERHPAAEGKPCLIGNCQAGWQIMMMAAVHPELVGPLLLAGSPLSYWTGVRGKNPMRYLGGILGGSWLTSLCGDLGNGVFDGANIVANFEYLDPANTLWKKSYNVYSKIDTEPPRFLEFEKWWGSPVLLNAEEMQYIVDELFIGNKMSSGELFSSKGVQIDLRNIKSPMVVFCSQGDNITPPQQALGWVLDIYDSTEDIAAAGQTIIYCLHQSIGHLGIFVSAKVATKEHQEFARNMDLIDVLPPGLYEAVITDTDARDESVLMSDNHLLRFEPRTLDHIRALGGNSASEDLCFATVARISDVNKGLYQRFVSPMVGLVINDRAAELMRQSHPLRLQYKVFSDENPLMQAVAGLAATSRSNRRAVEARNVFIMSERIVSDQIIDALDTYRDIRDHITETLFWSIYSTPLLQALTGLRSDYATARRQMGRDLARDLAAARAAAELEPMFARGGLREAFIRAVLYVLSRTGAADERRFSVLRAIRAGRPESRRVSFEGFKELVRQQYQLLNIDEEKAIATIPVLLSQEAEEDPAAAAPFLRRIVMAGGPLSEEMIARLSRIEPLFTGIRPAEPGAAAAWKVVAAPSTEGIAQRHSSRTEGIGERGRRTMTAKEDAPGKPDNT